MSRDDLRRAGALLAAGQAAAAGRIVAPVLASEPDSFDANILMASCLVGTGQSSEAVIVAERATEIQPETASGWAALSEAGMAADLTALAVVAAATARRLEPNSAAYAQLEANARVQDGTAGRETIATARMAIQLAPGEPGPHVTLGNVYWSLDRVRPAIAAYREALAIDPTDDAARSNLALVAFTAGDLGTSTRGYAELLAESPTDADRLMLLRVGAERALLRIQGLLWVSFLPLLLAPTLPIGFAFAVLSIAGYLLWVRLRAGSRLRDYARSFAQLDPLWRAWALGLLATLVGFVVASVLSGEARHAAVAVTAWVTLASSLIGVARLVLK